MPSSLPDAVMVLRIADELLTAGHIEAARLAVRRALKSIAIEYSAGNPPRSARIRSATLTSVTSFNSLQGAAPVRMGSSDEAISVSAPWPVQAPASWFEPMHEDERPDHAERRRRATSATLPRRGTVVSECGVVSPP
jgi:hypothetical protein